jgi:lycopene cyclase domain-containing protein
VTYWLLNAGFLGVVVVVAIAAIASRRAPRWTAVAIAAAILLVVTAVFDNVMIGAGLVAYDPAHVSGVRVGVAPIEDFAYAVAAVVALPCLWTLIGARRDRRSR